MHCRQVPCRQHPLQQRPYWQQPFWSRPSPLRRPCQQQRPCRQRSSPLRRPCWQQRPSSLRQTCHQRPATLQRPFLQQPSLPPSSWPWVFWTRQPSSQRPIFWLGGLKGGLGGSSGFGCGGWSRSVSIAAVQIKVSNSRLGVGFFFTALVRGS